MKRLYEIRKWILQSCLYTLFTAVLLGCGEPSDPQSVEKAAQDSSQSQVPNPPEVDIHTAVITGDTASVRQHITAGSDLDKADPYGRSSPLINAAAFGKTDIAKLLIDAGADINFTNGDGSTALHSAAFFCRPAIVELLLEEGADKTIRNNYGSTAYESVAAPFNKVKPIYDALSQSLGPMGLELDYDYLKATRPKIADMLR